jgi:putative ABC transport system ATP-binding protein
MVFPCSAHTIGKSYGRGAALRRARGSLDIRCRRIRGDRRQKRLRQVHAGVPLALLDNPDTGSLLVDGTDATKLALGGTGCATRTSFVFQQFFLTANASVLDNVVLPLKIAGVGAKERKARGMAALEQLEMADKAKSKAMNLSGGQKQRAVIARALVNDPKVIFADEPTGNLDSATGAVVEDILFSLNKDKGITLIVVTHDRELAARCDRQIFIRDGLEDTTIAHTGAHA